jgi:parvulin-like peptidyl-prolyl isomerase
MTRLIVLPLLLGLAFAQETEKPIATVDGKPLTQSEINMLAVTMNQKVTEAAGGNVEQALRYFGFLKKLTAMAEKENLAEQSPYKEKLQMLRLELLANAMMEHHKSRILVMPEEQKKYYDDNIDDYRVGKMRVIYLPFSTTLEEGQALQKGEDLSRKAAAGADFTALVKEHSKDKESVEAGGVFGPVNRNDTRHPEHIRAAIFALKVGEVSKPIRNPNGFYIFKMDELSVQPYAKVKDDIFTHLLETRFQKWLAEVGRSVEVKILPR